MSAMYSSFPLDEEIKSWLEEQAIEYPSSPEGRNPTLVEIKSAIANLEEYTIKETEAEVGKPWQAFIENKHDTERSDWATLNIITLTDDRNEFYFEKGCPKLIIKFMVFLAQHTGPLVLICDAGDPPLVVTGEADPKALFESWGN